VSPAWLSTLKGSDLFQSRLAELQGEIFLDLKQEMHLRLRGLAEVAVDRLAEKIRHEEDTDKVGRAAQLALEACGYASRRTANGANVLSQSVTVVGAVDKDQLAAARALLRARNTLAPPTPLEQMPALTAYDAQAEPAAG
jgi:hypothetical protein